MKYRSITLNGNKNHQYKLVKYNDENSIKLLKLNNPDKELVDCVKECPKIYSELSEHQSYMIFDRKKCVGLICITTSTNERNLELKVWFDDKYFESNNEILNLIYQLIDSLGLYFHDKENIEIELVNDIDLSKIDGFRFKKNIYDENLTTYIYSNKTNNVLIPALIDEIIETEKNLTDWKQYWNQSFEMCSDQDYDYDIDYPLFEEYEKGIVSLEEMFYKASALLWNDINSTKSTRDINFNRNGQIHFEKDSKNFKGIKYEFDYHILKDGFKFKEHSFCYNNVLEIDENDYHTIIKKDNLNIFYNKAENKKIITYGTPIINDSSIEMKLLINDCNIIEKCFVDFRTHKTNKKINGIYALRISPFEDRYTLNFISRKGFKSENLFESLFSNFYSIKYNEGLTFELINELIEKIVLFINNSGIGIYHGFIHLPSDLTIQNIVDTEKQIIDFIKQIKGEIPLPHLQSNLETFVSKNVKHKQKSL